MSRSSKQTLSRVCDFLGVDSAEELTLPVSYTSPNIIDRSVQVGLRDHFGGKFSEIIENIRMQQPIIAEITSDQDKLALQALKENLCGEKEPLRADIRHALQKTLAEDICRVSEIVDFSTEKWA